MRIKDSDLAQILEIETREVNQKYKRNIHLFTDNSVIKIPHPDRGGHGVSCYLESAAIILISLCRATRFKIYQEATMEIWLRDNLKKIKPGLNFVSQQEKLSQLRDWT